MSSANAQTSTLEPRGDAVARSWWVRLDGNATDRLSGRVTDERRSPSTPRRTTADIRTEAEIELMAEAGRVAALALRAAAQNSGPSAHCAKTRDTPRRWGG